MPGKDCKVRYLDQVGSETGLGGTVNFVNDTIFKCLSLHYFV